MKTTKAFDPALREELEELTSSMCKALNDPKRLTVLYALRDGARTVGELCEILGAPQSNTSQHLAVLRNRGLVDTTREGNAVRYSLRHRKILEAVDLLREVMADEVSRRHAIRNSTGARRRG
jgi:ArsR family transcriptional regulator, virulence genes transcriptional regulator